MSYLVWFSGAFGDQMPQREIVNREIGGRDRRGRFLSGNNGGPGRPKGSRNKLSEDFVVAVYEDWSVHGAAVLARVRMANPTAYLRLVSSLVPARLDVDIVSNDPFADMSEQDLRDYLARECEAIDLGNVVRAPRPPRELVSNSAAPLRVRRGAR
jgi:hypothetical protein